MNVMKRNRTKWAILLAACLAPLAQTARAADALDSWTANEITVAGTVSKVAFGNGLFVAVGAVRDAQGAATGATISTSIDGVNWTAQKPSGGALSMLGVTYGIGQYVAVGADAAAYPVILTSPDGTAWTARDAGVTNGLTAVTYGNGLYVATGWRGTIVTSPDAITWTQRALIQSPDMNFPDPMTGVAYGNGRFVAVGNGFGNGEGDVLATSPDGVTWTRLPISLEGRAVVFADGQFVVVGGYYLQEHNSSAYHFLIYSSADGQSWTLRQDVLPLAPYGGDPFHPGFQNVAYGGGQFLAVGVGIFSQPASYSSSDAVHWVRRPLNSALALAFGNGRFVAFSGAQAIHSGDIGKLGASITPTGQLDGTVTGVTGQFYAIKASLNLPTWGTLTNITVDTNGIASFTDSLQSRTGRRFYYGSLVQ